MQLVLVDWDQDFIQFENVDILGPPFDGIVIIDPVTPHQLAVEKCTEHCTFLSRTTSQT